MDVEVLIWLLGSAGLWALGLVLAIAPHDRAGETLAFLMTVTALIVGVGIVRFDDVIGNSDCVGVCISEFSYYSAWTMAWGGALVFLALFGVALVRAVVKRKT